MRILFVGAGATGGYFGGRLSQAGRDVTFLVRPGRADQLRRDGLTLLSPHGDVTLHPTLVTASSINGAYDAIIVAVKAYGLEQALEDMAPAAGSDSIIMPLLNGMRQVDLIRSRFGAALIGGVCKVATTIDREGRIKQLAPFQELAYGELDGEPSLRTSSLDTVMQGAGFTARLTQTIEQEMWEKWTLLAAMGALCCLMRGTIGEIEAAPRGRETALGILDEVVAVISADGIAPSPRFLETIRSQLLQKGSSMASCGRAAGRGRSDPRRPPVASRSPQS